VEPKPRGRHTGRPLQLNIKRPPSGPLTRATSPIWLTPNRGGSRADGRRTDCHGPLALAMTFFGDWSCGAKPTGRHGGRPLQLNIKRPPPTRWRGPPPPFGLRPNRGGSRADETRMSLRAAKRRGNPHPLWCEAPPGPQRGRKENGLPRAFGPRNDIFRRLVLWDQKPGDGTQAVPYN